MRLELLYFDECPNWRVLDARLKEALGELGRADIVPERRHVETPEQAEELRFIGSPSIRIDGIDPFASGAEPIGLACRLYTTPTGRSGSPTTAQLLEVLA